VASAAAVAAVATAFAVALEAEDKASLSAVSAAAVAAAAALAAVAFAVALLEGNDAKVAAVAAAVAVAFVSALKLVPATTQRCSELGHHKHCYCGATWYTHTCIGLHAQLVLCSAKSSMRGLSINGGILLKCEHTYCCRQRSQSSLCGCLCCCGCSGIGDTA